MIFIYSLSIFLEKKNIFHIKDKLDNYSVDSASIFHWQKRDLKNNHCDHSSTSNVNVLDAQLKSSSRNNWEIVLTDRRWKVCEILDAIGISYDRCFGFEWLLGYQKASLNMGEAFSHKWPLMLSCDNFEGVFNLGKSQYGRVFARFHDHVLAVDPPRRKPANNNGLFRVKTKSKTPRWIC